ncbi:hypothetical protein, partial [Streptococcus pseudopneumoniae]|uniref:hypothetical protein n=1 Tax=Streptococcus pseudopneumoniae TaxID=257758 RepID=UPI0019553C31
RGAGTTKSRLCLSISVPPPFLVKPFTKCTFRFLNFSTNYRKKNQKYDFYAARIEVSYIIL